MASAFQLIEVRGPELEPWIDTLGGLRLAVVGYERVITAEAGHRVGLSAGARMAHVAAGPLDPTALDDLRASAPDVVLLVGGTDGGNAEILLHNAAALAEVKSDVAALCAKFPAY